MRSPEPFVLLLCHSPYGGTRLKQYIYKTIYITIYIITRIILYCICIDYLYFRPGSNKTIRRQPYARARGVIPAGPRWFILFYFFVSEKQNRNPRTRRPCRRAPRPVRVRSDPQQTPVHRVEQDKRCREDHSALLVDPNRNLLSRCRQSAVQLTRWLFRHLKLHLAHRFHFHRVRQFSVQLRIGTLIRHFVNYYRPLLDR